MSFFANIAPIRQRVLESPCAMEILAFLAREKSSLRSVKHVYRITKYLGDKFTEGDLRASAYLLVNAGYIDSEFEGESGGMKNLSLTELGWAASGVPKPFWMDTGKQTAGNLPLV